MKVAFLRSGSRSIIGRLLVVGCATMLVPIELSHRDGTVSARDDVAPVTVAQDARIPADQLDSLVAPIALYPDPLLSQTLVASTYPLEIVQLQQWLEKNGNLKDKALVDAVSKQPWDPSIQAMAALPDVVKRLSDDLQWTTDLGNAFLAQQSDVMDAVQRMRQRAQGSGALASNQQQRVETQVVEGKTVVIVEQADPEVVYVPSYNPTVVYGEPLYPYPSIYYPPYTPGIVAASAISFGVGWAMGAAWGGGWGWGCGWGGNDININNNNNFNRNTNISNSGNRTNISGNRGGGNKWQHNPKHRGGAPYSNRATANRYGGTARGDSLTNRQAGARQQIQRQGGNLGSSTRAGASDRASGLRNSGAGDRGSSRPGTSDRARNSGGLSDRSGSRPGTSDRASGLSDRSSSRPGTSDRSSGARSSGVAGDRVSRSGSGDRSSSMRSSGGGDRIGSREVGRSSGGGGRSAFGDSSGFSGSRARASSNRGASSMGGSRGGGGGSRGGGSRGGGGGRRR